MKTRQTNIQMLPETHTRLKIAAVSQGMTIGSVIKNMLDKYYPLDAGQQLVLNLIETNEEAEK